MSKRAKKPKTAAAVRSIEAPENALRDRKTIITAKRLETVVAVLLGITTLLSAWASWIAHLHGGIQSINFTKSNNLASIGSAEYNLDMQVFLTDFMLWSSYKDYKYELEAAKAAGDQEKSALLTKKIEELKKQGGSEVFAEAIKWMKENGADNPFLMPGIDDKYFKLANEKLNESQNKLEEGMKDNTKGDSYMLVTVIYSLTLFLLGIVGTFKNMPNRIAVLGIAVAFLIFAFIYMCMIPLPTGFDNMNFFEFK